MKAAERRREKNYTQDTLISFLIIISCIRRHQLHERKPERKANWINVKLFKTRKLSGQIFRFIFFFLIEHRTSTQNILIKNIKWIQETRITRIQIQRWRNGNNLAGCALLSSSSFLRHLKGEQFYSDMIVGPLKIISVICKWHVSWFLVELHYAYTKRPPFVYNDNDKSFSSFSKLSKISDY